MRGRSRETWLPNFRRALGFLRPHRRRLVMGLLAAVGVSVFYTFSVSSIVPVLKIMFAEHESLADWLNRTQTQRRLGVVLPADVPDNPDGLLVADVRPNGRVAGQLQVGETITAVNGETSTAYSAARRIAESEGGTPLTLTVRDHNDALREITLTLSSKPWWWATARRAVHVVPVGRTADDRFWALVAIMLGVVVINTLGAACRFVNDACVALVVQRSMHDIRTALADHVLRLPIAWHGSQPPGDTLARFANDLGKVEVGIDTLFGKVVREPLKAVGVLALTILLDWHMLVIGAVGLPIGAIVLRVFGRMVKRAQRRASQSWGRLLDHLGERLSGIRVVKAYNMENAESARFSAEDEELTKAQTHIEMADAASRPALEMLAVMAICGFIIYGGLRVFQHELEPHVLFGAVICLGGVFDPLRKMGNVYNRLQAADTSAQRLFELMDLPLEATTPARTPRNLPTLSEQIEFRDLWFAYPSNPEHAVLCGVNLTVPRGQVVAIVGPNGCGKTTLVSLLLRFFEPTRGGIYLDNVNIADATLSSLRAQIGLVTQETVIFSGSVRTNIAYGANGVVEDDVFQAAQRAHAAEFIADLRVEQDGRVTTAYDAEIHPRTLSGGQRQRIVLARAILRDPPILILDEATSQVDAESERKIQQALEELTRDRTTFIIAHRFSTIARADMIVAMNEGRIAGIGTHAELLQNSPFYANLVQTQFAHLTAEATGA